MSILVTSVSHVEPRRHDGDWYFTTTSGWSFCAPAHPVPPTVGEQVIVMTALPDGAGTVVSLTIGGRVYVDGLPVVRKCAPGNTPAEIAAAEARGAEQMRARCLELATALTAEYVAERDAKREENPEESWSADDSAIGVAALALRIQAAKLESVPPGTHVPDRVSDGAILDAVRAAVQALLEDRMVQTPFHAGVENRWRDLLAAVSMPAERVPPGTHLDSGAPSTPR